MASEPRALAAASRARGRPFAAVVAAILLAGAPSLALADPTAAERENARNLMDQGDTKRDKGDLHGALKAFEAADAIMHVPTTGLEVARTQVQLGMLVEARETVGRVIRIPTRPNEPAPFVAARKAADQLATDLDKRIPTVTLAVTADPSQPPQATIDGETIAALDVPRKVNPGKHVIVVKSGAIEKREEVHLSEREQKTVSFDLKPKVVEQPPPPPPAGGDLGKPLMYGGFALAVVGIGVGSVTGLMSISKVNDVKKDCSGDKCPPERQGDIDSARSLGTISTIAFIAGGVGVGVGIAGLILSNKSGSERPQGTSASAGRARARVSPVVGPTWLGLDGSF
jgi:hypothetical protein